VRRARYDLCGAAQGHHPAEDVDKDEAGNRTVREFKEQEVFYGEIPLMSANGRLSSTAPSASSSASCTVRRACSSSGFRPKATISARSFPTAAVGWSSNTTPKTYCNVRIDRKAQVPGFGFLRALGLQTDADILRAFYRITELRLKDKEILWKTDENLIGLEAVRRQSATRVR